MSAPDRYGSTRVAKIKAAYDDLRTAVRSGDNDAAQHALDRYEPWADFAFAPVSPARLHAEELAEALREAESALATSYQVVDYPANGDSPQDHALTAVRNVLAKLEKEEGK